MTTEDTDDDLPRIEPSGQLGAGDHAPTGAASSHGGSRRRDILDEDVPRVLELLAQFGVLDTDTLKHRLEDWERWQTAAVERGTSQSSQSSQGSQK